MKVDLGELKRNKDELETTLKRMQEQFKSARAYLKAVTTSEALEGKVKEAIDQKIKNHQIPLMSNYLTALKTMSTDFDSLIKTFKSTVGEQSDQAVIDRDALHDLKAPFTGIEQSLSVIQRETSAIYGSIADILELKNPSTNKVISDLHEAKKVLTDTETKMAAFNSLQTKSSLSNTIAAQDKELKTLSSLQGLSYRDKKVLRYYTSTEFMLSVAENIKNQGSYAYRIQLQNDLAKFLKESRYSHTLTGRKILADREEEKKVYARFTQCVDKMSLEELKAEFPYVNASMPYYAAFSFSAEKTKRSDYVIQRYWGLIKQQPISERSLNFVQEYARYIRETGKNPFTGQAATKVEKIMAKYHDGLKGVTDTVGWGLSMASAYVGYQSYYGKPIIGLNTDFVRKEENISLGIDKIVSKYSDIYDYKYNSSTNPGPLAQLYNKPNVNFYGGRYNIEVLNSPKTLYRAGDSKNPLGQWFTEKPSQSIIEARINTAIKPIWTDKHGNYIGSSPLNTVYEIKVPAGTTIYRGPVASQGGIYQGGLKIEQIFIETPWKVKGIEVISSKQLN